MQTMITLIPLTLLAGAAALGYLALAGTRGRGASDRIVSYVACAAPGLAFILSLVVFQRLPDEGVVVTGWDWILAGSSWVQVTLAVDQLTCVMLLVVTGIGTLIHVYSTGYMKGDAGYCRFFACLNLFMFFMLVLVLADNLLLLFVGWEGVGLCSYLLIGFWWTDVEKASAGMKAFLVNRIGDAGFIIGMVMIFQTADTLSFSGLRQFILENPEAFAEGSGFFGVSIATASCLLLFLGAAGKSAQIPLYVWLPDAMAGPTPVSALIHAATMVTAGVYMIARMDVLFAESPTAMIVVSMVGGITAVMAGTIAMTQFDIKKVLAYSTVSQLGYMFVAVGLGATSVAIFHLVTHAFFKACLFLGSGSVIHGMGGEQDMRKMGGLKKRMPVTCWAMTVSAIAMAGIPPLAGFFSKDEILWTAISTDFGHGWFLWLMGIFAAFCTAIYMGRLILMTFTGSCRADEHTKEHLHESPRSMTSVLVILAVGAALVGFLNVPHFLGGHGAFAEFVNQSIGVELDASGGHDKMAVEAALAVLSVMVALAGLAMAWRFYVKDPELPATYAERYPEAYELIRDRYRVDELYGRVVVRPLERLAEHSFFRMIDRSLIDDTLNRLARGIRYLGARVSSSQSGAVRTYIAVMIGGLLLIMLSLLT